MSLLLKSSHLGSAAAPGPISDEDSVNKIFIINYLVILAPYEEQY